MEPLGEELHVETIQDENRMEEPETSNRDETEYLLGEEDEDEPECRVCRGPAEEDRPLVKPCKCSGSMGLVHQECLISWLEVTRGDGRCEICKTKFRFDPQYAENTPDRLPVHEVILGLSSRFLAKWLPLALRICFAAFLWLVVAPYLTNCLYLGWIIRPSSILARQDTILSDIVSGAVMGATIIISFLSLMSFADFLRVLWQQPPGEQRNQQQQQNEEEQNNQDDEADGNATDDRILEFIEQNKIKSSLDEDLKIDNESTIHNDDKILEFIEQNKIKSGLGTQYAEDEEILNSDQHTDGLDVGFRETNAELRWLAMEREERRQNDASERELAHGDNGRADEDIPLVDDFHEILPMDDDDSDNAEDNEDAWMDNEDEENEEDPVPLFPPPADEPVDDNVGFDPLDPNLQDDQVDMEINVALDELLGLRGPISTLVRNLLWLLAFNATYLGIFGFVPKTIGYVMYGTFFNTTLTDNVLKSIPFVSSDDQNRTTVATLLTSLEDESVNRNTTFKLSDFATVTLGYLSMAFFVVLMRYTIMAAQRVGKRLDNNPDAAADEELNAAAEFRRLRRNQMMEGRLGEDLNDFDNLGGVGESIDVVLDATVAIIKVCVLLFMKMFWLPMTLGICLDASTMRLFGHDVAGRLAFAGGDLFSFILLHWVAGITFMLLVTVFLLQLREVAHPDVLARLIRPQEPQPDLLGNLMHETVGTHVKRMVLSLAVYAPILALHVTVPVMLLHKSGLDSILSFYRLNFYHLLTPQLQIPLELIVFHLSMLALLERHKNTIGGLQHHWMKFICRNMGLTEHLLPLKVEGFRLIGTKSVFKANGDSEGLEVDPFFAKLATMEKDIDEFVLSNIDGDLSRMSALLPPVSGVIRLNGERVIDIGVRSITFPGSQAEEEEIISLPTKIGRYRLSLAGISRPDIGYTQQDPEDIKISIYREVLGEEIKRPPEGWDDLGAGGAFVQGRWAWTKERKSLIEASVAERTQFRTSSKERRSIFLMTKVVILILLSWVAVILTGLAILSFPLAVGRSFYHLLRIPPEYIHDPFAFCFGAGLFFPSVSLLTKHLNAVDESLYQRCRQWLGRFRRPPAKKLSIVLESILLWGTIAPLGLGLAYEFSFVKSSEWFLGQEAFLDWKTCAISWFMGTVVLNTWSFLLYFKFFTRQFWSNVGNGILEPPLNEDGNPNPNARNNQREDANADDGLTWQGKQGRVAKFFRVWRSVLFDWDWSTIDRTALVDEFARPTTKEIASTLVGSSLSFQLAIHAFIAIFKVKQGGFVFPLLGFVGLGLVRKWLFRFCMTVHILFQIGSRSRSGMDRWFEAAHEAARDDRYLIGELLMDYDPAVHGQ